MSISVLEQKLTVILDHRDIMTPNLYFFSHISHTSYF
jgi:hypothetical protein